VTQLLTRAIFGDDGQDLIEYGLLASVIAVALIVAIGVLGNAITQRYDASSAELAAS
jgi:Flp pilus assembly pilin Flp